MEPCLFRHGKSGSTGNKLIKLMLQWSHVFSDMVSTKAVYDHIKAGGLQWSHVFSDMVSNEFTIGIFVDTIASMEPCLFRHGKLQGQS